MKKIMMLLPAALVLAASATAAAQEATTSSLNLTPLNIRGGVLLAPPFATVDETYVPKFEGDVRYTGFQGDLLRHLAEFAKEDGYDLSFNLTLSPQNYGAALDVIANDCNTTDNPRLLQECGVYDFVVGDYYVNADRSMRIDFTPPWIRSSMSTIKLIQPEEGKQDIVTLSQLEGVEGTACVPAGTYLASVAMAKFPKNKYLECSSPDDCIDRIRKRDCALYVDDELALKYRALSDETASLEVTGESFNTQYIVWPMSYSLDLQTRLLLKKWIYRSVANGTLDQLDYKYFSQKICELGTAGETCENYCDPKRGRADRFGECVCNSMKWIGDDCSVEVLEDYNLYPAWLQALCYSLFAIQALVCISCGVWMYKKRETRQVKAAQPLFLNLVLFGCMLSTSSILVAAQQADPNSEDLPPCALFPWLFCLGFSITFGTLFAKIWRVWRLFKSAVEFQRVVITARYTLSIIAAITSVDVTICLVWTIVDPLTWTRQVIREDKYGEPLESVAKCTSDHWSAFVWTIAMWHTVVIILACVICYLSKDIPSKFSEGKSLAAAMGSNLQIILLSIPVLIIVANDPVPSLFVRAVVIWLNDLVVVLIIFGRLIRSVHDAADESHTLTVGQAMSQFKERSVAHQTRRRRSSRLGSDIASDDDFHDNVLSKAPSEKSIQRISIGSADGLNRRSSAETFDDPSTLTNSMNAPNRKDVEMSCDSEHDKDVLAAEVTENSPFPADSTEDIAPDEMNVDKESITGRAQKTVSFKDNAPEENGVI